MPTRFRELLAFVADIFGALTGILAAVAALTGVAALAANQLGPASVRGYATNVVVASAAFFCGVLVILIPAVRRFGRYLRGYEWLEGDYTYWIDPGDHTHHKATTVVTLLALRDDVRVFENRYSWSGTGSDPVPVATSDGHTVLGPCLWDGNYKHYFVAFNPPLARNESARIVLEHDFRDMGGTFQPFYAKVVLEPLRQLTMRILLPGQKISVASSLERASKDLGSKVIQKGAATVNSQTNEIVWNVPGRPKRSHYYRIDWVAS